MDALFPFPPPAPAPTPSDQEASLHQLLRQIIGGYFVLTDGQGAISKWSDPAELLFDAPADDALGRPFFGRLAHPYGLSRGARAWRAFLERGELPSAPGRCEVEGVRPDGGTFAMEAVFIPVKLDEGFDF